jgi:opacity protein-like surface antigen
MKIKHLTSKCLALASGVALAAILAVNANAQDVKPGFFVGTDAGLNLMPSIRVSQGGHTGFGLETDPGFRWGLEGGYGFQLTPKLSLAPELESGFMWNEFAHVKAVGLKEEAGGNLWQVPFLAKAVASYQLGKWTPYAGLGVGLDYAAVNLRSIINHPITYSHDSWGPAVQAEVGVCYQLCSHCDVGFGYKYMAVFDEEFAGLRTSNMQNHTLSVSFTYHL